MNNAVLSLTCVWFVFLSVAAIQHPEWVGQWKAKVEYYFIVEAGEIGVWSE